MFQKVEMVDIDPATFRMLRGRTPQYSTLFVAAAAAELHHRQDRASYRLRYRRHQSKQLPVHGVLW